MTRIRLPPKRPEIDAATIRTILAYDHGTGIFTWRYRHDVRKAWNSRYAGKHAGYAWKPAGCRTEYLSIRIFDYPFLGHRLAWLYVTGEWPTVGIDHKDGNGLNNKWDNLRLASKIQNAANAKRPVTNKTGLKGASLCKATGHYRATIRMGGKQKWLGTFRTAEEAHAAYVIAARQCHGEFARTE